MKKAELTKLRKQLTNEFRLAGDVTGLDVLDWYCRAGAAAFMRKADDFATAKASIRTAAAAPHGLLRRAERAVDGVLALLHARGFDVSKGRALAERKVGGFADVLASMRCTTPERPEFTGMLVRRVA